jgi:hypothetical protein
VAIEAEGTAVEEPDKINPASVEEAPGAKAEEEVAEKTSPPCEARFQLWVMVDPAKSMKKREMEKREKRERRREREKSGHTTSGDVEVEGGDLRGAIVGDLHVVDLVAHSVGVPLRARASHEGDGGAASGGT